MMNRMGMGLAVGAGYVLGRTKKMKLAFAVGTMLAGKRMHLGPRALADLVAEQLRNNPQFKELGDQLRGDLHGAGKAATGALVERQIEGLADRLHGRTAQVRDHLTGTPAPPASEERGGPGRSPGDGTGRGGGGENKRPGHDTPDAESEHPPKQAAKKTAAKKTAAAKRTTAAKKTPAKKTAPGRAAPARKATRKTARSRTTRGGGGDD